MKMELTNAKTVAMNFLNLKQNITQDVVGLAFLKQLMKMRSSIEMITLFLVVPELKYYVRIVRAI